MKLATLLAELEEEEIISIEDLKYKELFKGSVKSAVELLKNGVLNANIYCISPQHSATYNYLVIGISI